MGHYPLIGDIFVAANLNYHYPVAEKRHDAYGQKKAYHKPYAAFKGAKALCRSLFVYLLADKLMVLGKPAQLLIVPRTNIAVEPFAPHRQPEKFKWAVSQVIYELSAVSPLLRIYAEACSASEPVQPHFRSVLSCLFRAVKLNGGYMPPDRYALGVVI